MPIIAIGLTAVVGLFAVKEVIEDTGRAAERTANPLIGVALAGAALLLVWNMTNKGRR